LEIIPPRAVMHSLLSIHPIRRRRLTEIKR
jgi:hypothetical protein